MKKKKYIPSQHQKNTQLARKPEIISLEELQEGDRSSDLRELEKSQPHIAGEQSASGSMPNPEHVTSKTTLERAKKMGVYKKPKKRGHT